MLRLQGGREVAQVAALVAAGGEDDALAPALEVAQPDAERECIHLAADVVHVVLALHVESDRIEQVGEHRPVGGVAPVAHVQGSGGIGGHELHLDPAPCAPLRAPVPLARGRDLRHHALEGRLGEMEVDEAGTRDLDPADPLAFRQACRQALRDVARFPLQQRRQAERDRGREVTVTGIARALHHDLRQRRESELSVVAQGAERVLDEFVQVLLQGFRAATPGRRIVESSTPESAGVCAAVDRGMPANVVSMKGLKEGIRMSDGPIRLTKVQAVAAVIMAIASVVAAGVSGAALATDRLDKRDQAIYSRIDTLEEHMNVRFDGVDKRIDDTNKRIDQIRDDLRQILDLLKKV